MRRAQPRLRRIELSRTASKRVLSRLHYPACTRQFSWVAATMLADPMTPWHASSGRVAEFQLMIDRGLAPSRSTLSEFSKRALRILAGAIALSLVPRSVAASEPGLPEATPPALVTLDELRAFAERHAPGTRVAQSRRAHGVAARAVAGAWLHDDPTLTLEAGPRFAGDQRGVDLRASLAQPVEIAGERGLRRAAAISLSGRLDAELALAELALRRDVSLAYHAVLVAEERRRVAARLRALAELALNVAQRRLGAGEATGIDLYVAEADAARARAAELAAQNELWSDRLELARVTGWARETPPMAASEPASVERPAPLEALLRRYRTEHPEVLARKAAARAAHVQVELADRRAWPSPTFGLALAREASLDGPANYIALGSVSLPLPLWSRNRAEREQSRAEEVVANTEQNLAALEQQTRLASAHAALVSAAARVELLDGGAGRALEAGLTLLERSLERGESSLLELAAARERLANAQLDALSAHADYYRARAELEYALGAAEDVLGGGDVTASPQTGGAR